MAVLPTTKRISREDMKEAPDWIVGLLAQINTFFDAIYNAVNGQLTFVENISAQIKEMTFTTQSDYSSGSFETIKFASTLKRRSAGVILLNIYEQGAQFYPIVQSVYVPWNEINGEINIPFVTGLDDATTYTMKVMVI